MKSFIAVALVLAAALPCQAQSFAYYPDDNTAPNFAAPAGWYPWFTNATGSRLQILVPASALASITGPITSIGGFLGNSGPTAGAASVTFANFQVRIGPAGVPALTNTFATNLVPGTETLVVDSPGLTLPVNPAGGWQDVPVSVPYIPPGGAIVVDFQTSIPVAGGVYFLSSVSSTVPRCVAATYTGQATGTLSSGSGTKVRFGYTPDNILVATTTGGGTGDLFLSLTMITPGAVEGYTLATTTTVGPLNSGPLFGIWPSQLTFDVINTPVAVGNPLHFLVGIPGVFPDAPIFVPAPALAFLAGQTWDVVAVVLGPGLTYLGKSTPNRLVW
jgi:hypothetical protein